VLTIFFSLVIKQERQLTGSAMVNSKILLNTSSNQAIWKVHHNGGWKPQDRGRTRNNGKQCTFCHKLYYDRRVLLQIWIPFMVQTKE